MMSHLIENVAIGSAWAKRVLAAGALMAALLMAGLAASPAYASTTYIVNSTADAEDPSPDGTCDTCTLREAIQEANNNNNPSQTDQINFNISGTGVKTISPNSPLPFITEPVIINGYSQPGSKANTLAKGTNAKLLIEIDGNHSGTSLAPGLFIAASDSVVKGLVINRFVNADAIDIGPEGSTDPADVVTNVRIEGNFLGTNPSGTIDRGNTNQGVFIFDGSYNTIGGASPATRNLISGNDFDGVAISGTSGAISTGNKVVGNLIGTQKDGIHALGNSKNGVNVFGDGAFGNRILSNSIFSNGGLGIDLGANGPTANDSGDTDTGPNSLQNFPVLSSAKTISGKTSIRGKLNSRPGATYTIQLFSNPSGTNEGRTFIGQKVVSTNINGNVSFTFSPKNAVAVGQTITATATMNTTGDTSEFSTAREVISS